MSTSTRVVLAIAERVAAAILVAIPAIRAIASEVDSAKAEIARIREDVE